MPIGSSFLPRDQREWSSFLSQSGIQAESKVRTFTPTWTGFTVVPDGDLKYMDFGKIAVVWTDAALLGTSGSSDMTMSGFPTSIRPVGGSIIPSLLVDGGITVQGALSVNPTTFVATFYLTVTNTGDALSTLVPTNNAFTSSGDKGLPAGWTIIFPTVN